MQDSTTKSVTFPSSTSKDVLTELLREGAQRMLATTIEAEVADWIESHADLKDTNGHRQVVRNGYLPERNITTGVGGVPVDPKLATGDGALGFWKAIRQVYPATREQRCTVHKTANVLDKLPKRLQPAAKGKLHDIWQADTRENANRAFDLFMETYEAKYPKATACLGKDREALLAFYDFPAEHWIHLRTTNPIESTFATVRLRHRKTKGNGSRKACLTMVFKLVQSAEKKWRLLNGSQLIPEVIQGVRFINGEREEQAAA